MGGTPRAAGGGGVREELAGTWYVASKEAGREFDDGRDWGEVEVAKLAWLCGGDGSAKRGSTSSI